MPGAEDRSGRPGEVVLVVDAANVVGSRPDGWWRDRAGAATRLLTALAPLAGAVVVGPQEAALRCGAVVVVLEGAARAAAVPPETAGLQVVLAPADGDSEVVARARAVVATGRRPLVVTADRGLRARLPDGSDVAGPTWLLDVLEQPEPVGRAR